MMNFTNFILKIVRFIKLGDLEIIDFEDFDNILIDEK